MDCNTAQRLMDVCRPSGEDWAEPDLSPVAAHLEECPDCLSHFRTQQALDARIASALQAVPVPSELRERIHARLDRTEIRRRRWNVAIGLAGAVAATVLLAVGVNFLKQTPTAPIEIASPLVGELVVAIVEDDEISSLRMVPQPPFDSNAITDWCDKQLRELKFKDSPAPKWPPIAALLGVGRAPVAERSIAVFQYNDPRGPVDVLAFPQRQFVLNHGGSGAQVILRTRGYAVIGWVEDKTTYVAVLKGWAPADWKRLIGPTGGAT